MSAARAHKYKMADLVERTGFSREAIRFYISTGLLPPPAKTSRNMAWYGDSHIELLETIRTLQNEQFLPLKAIKSILHGAPEYDFSERQAEIITNLRDKLGNANGRTDASEPGHGSDSPVPAADLAQLEELGWVSAPSEEQMPEDREILALWAELRDNGLSRLPGVGPRNINYVLEAVDFLFDRELDFFREHLSGLKPEESLEFVRRGYVIVNRLFALLHGRRVTMLGKRLAEREALSAKKKKARSATPASRKTPKARAKPRSR